MRRAFFILPILLLLSGGSVLDAVEETVAFGRFGHIIRARCAPLSPASGFPASRSQQVIHEASGLDYILALATSVCPFLILERNRAYLANTIKPKGEARVTRKRKA